MNQLKIVWLAIARTHGWVELAPTVPKSSSQRSSTVLTSKILYILTVSHPEYDRSVAPWDIAKQLVHQSTYQWNSVYSSSESVTVWVRQKCCILGYSGVADWFIRVLTSEILYILTVSQSEYDRSVASWDIAEQQTGSSEYLQVKTVYSDSVTVWVWQKCCILGYSRAADWFIRVLTSEILYILTVSQSEYDRSVASWDIAEQQTGSSEYLQVKFCIFWQCHSLSMTGVLHPGIKQSSRLVHQSTYKWNSVYSDSVTVWVWQECCILGYSRAADWFRGLCFQLYQLDWITVKWQDISIITWKLK